MYISTELNLFFSISFQKFLHFIDIRIDDFPLEVLHNI